MTTYNTYQEAKIANPESLICKFGDKFTIDASRFGQALQPCNPADHCMSMLTFKELGHKLSDGDVYQNEDGRVFTVGKLGYEAKYCNLLSSYCFPSRVYILRAAALENQMNTDNLATQTPEEKEALDNMAGISREHLLKMIKLQTKTIKELNEELNSSESPNGSAWDGEGLPPVGSLCKVNRDSFTYRVMYSSEYVVIVQNLDNDNTTAHGMDIILDLHKGNYTFSKPESQQQREERERDEKAKQIMIDVCGDDAFKDRGWDYHKKFTHSAKIAFKLVDLGYRKESN